MNLPVWMPEIYHRTAMALNPVDRDQWIQDHGPYLEHWTRKENVPAILKEGLKPPEYEDENFNNEGNLDYEHNPHSWGGYLQTRPGHVYLGKPGFVIPGRHMNERGQSVYEVPLRVDLRKLDSTKLKADEDQAHHMWNDWMETADPDTRDWMEETSPPESYLWEPGTFTRGDWGEEAGLEEEPWTVDSLRGGSIAHEGPIPPEAISLHPDYMDRYVASKESKHGFFYHLAPREHREAIEKHGLLPSEEAPTSPWAEKRTDDELAQEQPSGVYMWDDPTNARLYAYGLEGYKHRSYPGDPDFNGPLWYETPHYEDYMGQYPGALDEYGDPYDQAEYDRYRDNYQPPPLYDIWKVNTLGFPEINIDPENALFNGSLTAEEAQKQINEDRTRWGIETQEGHRWYVPHKIEPSRLTLHDQIYPQQMTTEDAENVREQGRSVPRPWARVPLNEWNEKARQRYLGDPTVMREIDPIDRTGSARFGSMRYMSSGDWFCPAYGIPDDVKEQIQEWAKGLPWDEMAKLQDPSKYHITSFYSPAGYANSALHQWVNSESGASYPAYTHSLDTFSSPDKGNLSPIVMRFHAPELSAHAEHMMNAAEEHGLTPARFEGGHKPHITLGHNPEGFQIQPPHIEFHTNPLHELHSYYDSLR